MNFHVQNIGCLKDSWVIYHFEYEGGDILYFTKSGFIKNTSASNWIRFNSFRHAVAELKRREVGISKKAIQKFTKEYVYVQESVEN